MAQQTKMLHTLKNYNGWQNVRRLSCNESATQQYVGPVPYVDSYQRVTSERRPKPSNDKLLPNTFIVHKYKADSNVAVLCEYCNSEYKHHVRFTPIRAQQWAAMHCSPQGLLPGSPESLDPVIQNLCKQYELFTDNAKADVFAKANQPKIFDSAPVIAELGETLVWFGGSLKGLYDFLEMIVKLKWGKVFSTMVTAAKEPESLWLEYRYAIMPFLLTIEDVVTAFKGGKTVKSYDARIVQTLEKTFTDPSWFYNAGTKPNFGFSNNVIDTVSATARLTVRSQCDPAPLGMSMWDAVRAGYEIIPLSFVLNWIIGIEEWLLSLRNTELEVKSSYVTTVVDRKGHVWSNDSGVIHWIVPADWTYHEYMMVREVSIEPPLLPCLQAEKLSLFRTVDALSLTVAFLKSFLTHKTK